MPSGRQGPTHAPTADTTAERNTSFSPDLLDRFADFAQQCMEFCDVIIQADKALSNSTSDETMDFNMLLAKTVFSKWSPEILTLLFLAGRPTGFEEIRKGIGPISPQVLSSKLGQLEEQGLVERSVLPTKPTRVKYSLTEHGWKVKLLEQPIVLYLRLTMDAGVLRRLVRTHGPYPNGLMHPSEHRKVVAQKAFARGSRT